ncbi:MAG: serine protease [Cryomorphaceae bacterium BACL21 MAG-121220-bin10]|jgi:serine protease Do|nr:MAG: serine protease [Cryomorphaceae bacterium BACL21 MAG-121220-bin10]
MKRFIVPILISALTTLSCLFIFKYLQNQPPLSASELHLTANPIVNTSFSSNVGLSPNLDFTEAAEKSIHAVVHVKNTTISRQPTSMMDLFLGGGNPRAMIGTGSGVIISPDGYIISNNHVIEHASDLQVTLNNNRTYPAELIGSDPKTDIALLKINAEEALPYIPFADSDQVKIGQWVLAVGNPFNLTSTVTAGIVSAKARDLNEFDNQPQSFIQTDAAVNRGNSGGALVNTNGELIGINTAITSETGSYVGYSFAVPSNTARKVIEDLMEYGDVQQGILGIQGSNLDTQRAAYYGVSQTQGVYVAGIEPGSGAQEAGLQTGDIIQEFDGKKVLKFSDLTGLLTAKRPNDRVKLKIVRDDTPLSLSVLLKKRDSFVIEALGLELKNTSPEILQQRDAAFGVMVHRSLKKEFMRYDLTGILITHINDQPVKNIEQAQSMITELETRELPIKVTFVTENREKSSIIFR